MSYKLDDQVIGYPPIESVPIAAPATGAYPLMTPGSLVLAEDRVWGPGEFIFARANGAIRQFGLCVATPVWDATNLTFTWNMTEVPNTANLGRSVFVAQTTGALASGQFGWFLASGITPVNGTASVAADTAFGITAAGQVGAIGNGKQVANARVLTAATGTVVKAGTGLSGDTRINVKDTSGWFPGAALTGTNVGASALIASVDPLGKFVIATVANSADVASNVTATYNDGTIYFNVVQLNRAFAQGQIV